MSAFSWTDRAVREALGLRADFAEEAVSYTGVSTDSRTTRPGELYVALRGERFDGHEFVADAFSRGARGAVVSRPVCDGVSARLYPVADTLEALGALAAHRRRALAVPVVAITGSAGKTMTKNLCAAALGSVRRVHATRGNLNNRIGLPMTLLTTPDEAEVVVLEMGTNEPGEIGALAGIARPEVAVVTTVGESHLERLGSLEGVMEEKLDLLRSLAPGGTCVVGDEPSELGARARRICPQVVVAGWGEEADVRPEEPAADESGRYTFRWKNRTVALSLPGRHAVGNALLALTVADLLGTPADDAVRGLAAAERAPMRGEMRRIGGLSVLVDCYNANPQSVRAALGLLEEQATAGRRVAVLGSMLELGTASTRLHREVLANALGRKIDLVVATGLFASAVQDLPGSERERVLLAADWRAAYPVLRSRLAGDEVILLKASRGVAMEGILPLLEQDFAAAGQAGEGR